MLETLRQVPVVPALLFEVVAVLRRATSTCVIYRRSGPVGAVCAALRTRCGYCANPGYLPYLAESRS